MDLPIFKIISRTMFVCGSLLLSFLGQGFAVDRYVIASPSSVMMGDTDVSIEVTPMDGVEIDRLPHMVQIFGLPPHVTLIPGSSTNGFSLIGPKRFSFAFDSSALPGPFVLKVMKSNDSKIFGQKAITLERSVVRFTLTPLVRPFIGSVRTPFQVQLIARDVTGSVVTSFKGDVELSASVGGLEGGIVRGNQFEKGIVIATVEFLMTDPLTQSNRLSARSRDGYGLQGAPATGSIELAVRETKQAP